MGPRGPDHDRSTAGRADIQWWTDQNLCPVYRQPCDRRRHGHRSPNGRPARRQPPRRDRYRRLRVQRNRIRAVRLCRRTVQWCERRNRMGGGLEQRGHEHDGDRDRVAGPHRRDAGQRRGRRVKAFVIPDRYAVAKSLDHPRRPRQHGLDQLPGQARWNRRRRLRGDRVRQPLGLDCLCRLYQRALRFGTGGRRGHCHGERHLPNRRPDVSADCPDGLRRRRGRADPLRESHAGAGCSGFNLHRHQG